MGVARPACDSGLDCHVLNPRVSVAVDVNDHADGRAFLDSEPRVDAVHDPVAGNDLRFSFAGPVRLGVHATASPA